MYTVEVWHLGRLSNTKMNCHAVPAWKSYFSLVMDSLTKRVARPWLVWCEMSPATVSSPDKWLILNPPAKLAPACCPNSKVFASPLLCATPCVICTENGDECASTSIHLPVAIAKILHTTGSVILGSCCGTGLNQLHNSCSTPSSSGKHLPRGFDGSSKKKGRQHGGS